VAAAQSPYVVPVHDLVYRPGEYRDLLVNLAVPEQLGQGAMVVREGEALGIGLRLEGLHEGILVTAELSTTARGECVRCLDPVELALLPDFQELYAYTPTEGLDYVVVDDRIDLEPAVRDAIVLALPFQPLCRPDCPGLDPATGAKRVAPAEDAPGPVDPRWGALEGFRLDD